MTNREMNCDMLSLCLKILAYVYFRLPHFNCCFVKKIAILIQEFNNYGTVHSPLSNKIKDLPRKKRRGHLRTMWKPTLSEIFIFS